MCVSCELNHISHEIKLTTTLCPPPHTHTLTQLLSLSLCCLHYDHIPLLFLKNNDWPKWSFKFVYCALITSLRMTWLKIMLLCCLEAHIAILYLFIFWAGLCLSPSIMSVTLPLSVLPALWPDTVIVLEEQWLTLMIILIWCIEYSAVFLSMALLYRCLLAYRLKKKYMVVTPMIETNDFWSRCCREHPAARVGSRKQGTSPGFGTESIRLSSISSSIHKINNTMQPFITVVIYRWKICNKMLSGKTYMPM